MAKNGKANGKSRGARRSKADSMTEAKANKAEMRQASDAQPEMDLPKPDDILFHMRSIKGLKERATTVNAAVRNARKSAAKLNKFLPVVIDELLALERADDQTAFQHRMEMLGLGLQAIGHHVQLSIHDTLLGDVNEAAELRGYKDAKAGRVAGAVYPEGSDLHALYMKGWQRGTAENLGMTIEDTDDALLVLDEAGDNGARQLREEASVN